MKHVLNNCFIPDSKEKYIIVRTLYKHFSNWLWGILSYFYEKINCQYRLSCIVFHKLKFFDKFYGNRYIAIKKLYYQIENFTSIRRVEWNVSFLDEIIICYYDICILFPVCPLGGFGLLFGVFNTSFKNISATKMYILVHLVMCNNQTRTFHKFSSDRQWLAR